MVVSPLFKANSTDCLIHISINLPSDNSARIYVYSLQTGFHFVNATADHCQSGFISNKSMIAKLISFRVIVLSKSSQITSNANYGSVTSHQCLEFEPFTINPDERTTKPDFAFVKQGVRNLCTVEIFQEKFVECDWMNILHIGNDKFNRTDTHDCVKNGVSHKHNDGYIWFLSLDPSRAVSVAYLISPVIEGGTSHLLFSFWYLPKCNGTNIKAFLVPSYQSIHIGIENKFRLVFEVIDSAGKNNWEFFYKDVKIPSTLDSFQVNI